MILIEIHMDIDREHYELRTRDKSHEYKLLLIKSLININGIPALLIMIGSSVHLKDTFLIINSYYINNIITNFLTGLFGAVLAILSLCFSGVYFSLLGRCINILFNLTFLIMIFFSIYFFYDGVNLLIKSFNYEVH